MGACVRTCKSCQNKFEPKYNTIQPTCSIQCAIDYANDKKLKERRKDTRKRKQVLLDQDRGYQIKKAQESFNAYIRERDKHENCVSCQRQPKKRNAGHFKSIGGYPELRFHEFNCHLQCEHCNTYLSGNIGPYRELLVDRIGQRNVEWLEGPHKPQKLSIEDIKEIRQYYKQQLKYLKSV